MRRGCLFVSICLNMEPKESTWIVLILAFVKKIAQKNIIKVFMKNNLLDERSIDRFRKDGFLGPLPLIDEDEIDEIRSL